MIKKVNELNEPTNSMNDLLAKRKELLKEIEKIDKEIENLSNNNTDPIVRLNAWLSRPSHKNTLSYLPGGLIRKWLDEYVWKDNLGDPDFYPKHSTQSLVESLMEYGMDHNKGGYYINPGDPNNTIDFQIGVNGITEALIDEIIKKDYDNYKINW